MFILLFIFDLFTLFSNLFLFQLNEFIANIKFANLYQFNASQFLLVLLGIAYTWIIVLVLKRSQKKKLNKKQFLFSFFLIYGILFIADIATGNSVLYAIEQEERAKHREKDFKNLASSIFYDQFQDLTKVSNQSPVYLKDTAVSYSNFVHDTIGNQMTIIVESGGPIADSAIQKKFEQQLIKAFNEEGYAVKRDLVNFMDLPLQQV